MNGFLEYVPGTSLMHCLNPVVKLIGAIVFAVACFAFYLTKLNRAKRTI